MITEVSSHQILYREGLQVAVEYLHREDQGLSKPRGSGSSVITTHAHTLIPQTFPLDNFY